jgi:dUTP pyrophosphatase
LADRLAFLQKREPVHEILVQDPHLRLHIGPEYRAVLKRESFSAALATRTHPERPYNAPMSPTDTRIRIRIKRLREGIALPTYASGGAAAFDLAASEDVTVPPREVRLVPTGLVIEVPPGMFLGVFARSSTPLKRGLMVANGVGVVDPDYCGPADEVKVPVLNFTGATVRVAAGDRIAQGIVLAAPTVEWEESATLAVESRGGFGSTDR